MRRLLRLLLAPAARRALEDRLPRREIRRVLGDAFRDYGRRRASLPPEKGTGGRMMVHLAA